jgi:transcriptional regulator with XRE-family HTH domain
MDRDEAALAAQLARNLKGLRRARGWTQADLAQRIDLTPHYVALIETEQRLPALRTLLVMAKVFGVPVDRLLATAAPPTDGPSQIARLLATAPAEVQLMIREMIDVSLKRTSALTRRTQKKKKR